jgi:hypothetical protein
MSVSSASTAMVSTTRSCYPLTRLTTSDRPTNLQYREWVSQFPSQVGKLTAHFTHVVEKSAHEYSDIVLSRAWSSLAGDEKTFGQSPSVTDCTL